jgi:PAS domain S-box-containing protein
VFIGLATLTTIASVFLGPGAISGPRKYLVLAVVTWTAARLGQRAVAVTLLGISGLAAWAVVGGTGPFTPLEGPALQVFLGTCGIAGFGVAAIAFEREEAAGLREREARYRVLADASPNLMWSGTSDGAIDFFNQQALLYTGLDESAAGGLGWLAVVHPEDLERTRDTWQQATAGRRKCSVEHRVRRADGQYRWHWAVVVPTEDGPARVRWIGTATDIHDRKVAELELASWRVHYERAQEVGQLGSWESDLGANGELVWSSELFRIFGVDPHQFDRRLESFYALVHPEDLGRLKRAASDAVTGRSRYSIDHRIVRPGGEMRWVHEEADLTTAADGTERLVGVCRDITERVREKEERRLLEQSLLQAQKLESLGMLAGGIAHDFNNLLVGILGNASLALLDLPADSPARPAIQRIETTSTRAADLIRQMLAYSGKGSMAPERVDVSALVSEMGDLLATAVSKKAQLAVRVSSEPLPVDADPTQLRQVVMNLITNASDAIGDRPGTIVIETGMAEIDARQASTALAGFEAGPGAYVRIDVSDTGAGMDATTQARMFDPFFSTKFTGRGLGLAAVQGIVRSHRGAIQVRSAVGVGTTCTVLLPRASAPAPAPAAQPRGRLPLTALFSGTALVVDDEDTVRHAVGLMLQRFGFDVLSATSGREGLELIERHRADLAAVVLDLTMPDMSGADVLRDMRSRGVAVPVLLVSGYDPSDVAASVGGAGNVGFLQKPFRPAQLADALRVLVETPAVSL